MTYEQIQSILTLIIEAVAIAPIFLVVHHAYTSTMKEIDSWGVPHATVDNTPETRVDTTLLTPEIPSQPEETEQPIVADPWQIEITTSSPRYWVRLQPETVQPTLYLLPPAQEEVKPAKKSRKTTASPKAPTKSHTRKRKAA